MVPSFRNILHNFNGFICNFFIGVKIVLLWGLFVNGERRTIDLEGGEAIDFALGMVVHLTV